MTDLAVIRSRAAAHQEAIDLATRFLTPQLLAARWSCSVSSVKAIPRDVLPFIEIGSGRLLKRRRYDPGDVLRYEGLQRAADAR